jgi:ABC-type glycerol-3-phosphate transport system substrate-binding protein
MSQKLSRREMLKLMASGSAAAALSPVASALGEVRAKPAAQEVTEISYWQAPIWRYGADNETILGSGSDEWILDAIARFEAENPDVKVNMELIPWDQWNQKVTTAFAGGDLPNVIYNSLTADRVQAGLFEPLDDYLADEMKDNWLPGGEEAVTIFGRVYSVPAIVNPHGAALSKTALEMHGGAGILDAIGENRGGLTFDMIKEYGEEFGDGSSRYFFGIPTDHGSVVYWMFGTWLAGWGIQSWTDDEERWIVHEHENAVAAFQWIVDAQNEWGVMLPNLPTWADVDNFYWNLNCGFRYQWPGIQTELEVAQEAGQAQEDFEIVLAGPPCLPDVAPFAAGGGPAASYQVCRTEDLAAREAAFRWANWLATDDSNAVGLLVNGYFPATKSGAEEVADHPFMEDPNRRWILETYLPTFEPEIKGGNYQPITNARTSRIWNQVNPWDYYLQQFQSLLLGQKTPEEMLMEMAERINGALGAEI